MFRIGISARQIENAERIEFLWTKGRIFYRWELIENLPERERLLVADPGHSERERVLAKGRSFTLENARIAAENWLGVHHRKPLPPETDGRESVLEMLGKLPL